MPNWDKNICENLVLWKECLDDPICKLYRANLCTIQFTDRFLSSAPLNWLLKESEIQTALGLASKQLGINEFKVVLDWLFRFIRRQNVRRREIRGECLNTDIETVETFRNKYGVFLFKKIIQLSYLYNLDMTASYWKASPVEV